MKNGFLILLVFFASALNAQSIETRLEQQMIDEAAPDFTLKNIEGQEVSLSALKGKTIVLDFWATWCGPCIASFPGIQEVVNDYADDEDVVFLFIDTWENGSDNDKVAKVKKFIEKKGYNFNVLFDLNDKVVSDYGLKGIPTKFVVGPDGNIKFRKIGGGSSEVLAEELYAMIELSRKS